MKLLLIIFFLSGVFAIKKTDILKRIRTRGTGMTSSSIRNYFRHHKFRAAAEFARRRTAAEIARRRHIEHIVNRYINLIW